MNDDAHTQPAPGHPRDAGTLRERFLHTNYTVDAVNSALGDVAAKALTRSEYVPVRRVLRGISEPAARLAELFMLGDVLDTTTARAALGGEAFDAAQRLGILRVDGGHARAHHAVWPHQESWYVASDFPRTANGPNLHTDYVMGIGAASTTCASFHVRGMRCGATWDLGTGSGVQALHAATYSDTVVATDISDRAARFAALSVALSGENDIDVRRGDLAKPVQGQRFDRIISNPPFVITPRTADVPVFTYRDAGRTGDALFAELLDVVGGHLTDNGLAQFLTNWEVPHGHTAEDALADILGRTQLPWWTIIRQEQDPAEYAELWCQDAGSDSPQVYRDHYEAYLADFATRDVASIAYGMVLLGPGITPPPGGTVRRVERQVAPLPEAVGAHLGEVLATRRRWAACDHAERAGLRFVVSADVTEERHVVPGNAEPSALVLRQTAGFARAVHVPTTVAAAVGCCDGELAIGQVCDGIAHLLGVDRQAVLAEVLDTFDDLLWSGMLAIVG